MASNLPDYVAAARPVPQASRAPWFKNTAPTYAGIMLWFVFWHEVPVGSALQGAQGYSEFAGGTLGQGLGIALLALILAALLCYFLFYLVPGMLGMKTGLPLYIVGTSTYGVQGGFLMPGFLMGVLQFGWLGVNAYFSAMLLAAPFGQGAGSPTHWAIAAVWAIAAAFMGLKGIQYVAKVAGFLPLIPLTILVVLFFSSVGGVANFDHKALVARGGRDIAVEKTKLEIEKEAQDLKIAIKDVAPKKTISPKPPLDVWQVFALICTYVVGFFATAGAAGTDFGMNNRDEHDVKMGGLVGIAGATIFAGGLSLFIVAGVHGANATSTGVMQTSALMDNLKPGLGEYAPAIFWYLLAIAAFPPACFSAFIAANSFKTTLPNVNPLISCGIGTLVSIALAVTGYAGDAVGVFKIIGASFGPVCGAMVADYLLAGRKWAGPRAGFNPAGWISWVAGFVIGAADFIPGLAGRVACPPVAAFLIGFALYYVLAKLGMESKKLEMPEAAA